MPEVFIQMFEGRSIEQKRELVREVTDAVTRSLGVHPDVVTVQLIEGSKQNRARGGRLFSDLHAAEPK
ncbi:MAG: tautomerase family protein [Burkholderiales bacterium]|nr:tautomerase family protein [Burkholderiales bacterium]